jgi:hypothetical protein
MPGRDWVTASARRQLETALRRGSTQAVWRLLVKSRKKKRFILCFELEDGDGRRARVELLIEQILADAPEMGLVHRSDSFGFEP